MNNTRVQRDTQRLAGDDEGVTTAAAILRAGGLVAFPTETVYGLGADATDFRAVAAIYAAKGRPRFNPLIAHCAGIDAARREGMFDAPALALARAFWPGPLTLVVPASPGCGVCDLARAGLDSVALRVPDHPLARDLITRVGRPVAAPSANRSGHVSPTTPEHVLSDLDGRIDAVIAAGPTRVGVESTIVACLGGAPRLLRAGGAPRALIEAAIGRNLVDETSTSEAAPLAPGRLAAHYAPNARVRLDAQVIRPGEAALLFGPSPPAGIEDAAAVLNLSVAGDVTEAAANLFAALRALDATGARVIATSPIPETGLGEAIRDRLRRAAADR